MHCLRWWLPIFLLPLPAASPFLLLLFVISYAIRTKPCAYCAVIILGLMLSTCSFYHYAPLLNNSNSNVLPTQSLQADKAIPISLPVSSTSTPNSSIQSKQKSPSSCWIDFTSPGNNQWSKLNLGRWSAHTWRRYPSVLSQSNLDTSSTTDKHSTSWRSLLSQGIFIGFNETGFRLKLVLE